MTILREEKSRDEDISHSSESLSPAAGNHLRGVLQAGVGDFGAAQHARHFMRSGAIVEDADARLRAAVRLTLFDGQMLIGEGGDLRQMRYTQNLLRAGEGFELLADGLGGAASDADIDFVEDQRTRSRLLSGL